MYCSNCGKEIDDKAVVCPQCGVATGKKVNNVDESSVGWGVLGFFFPLIGLILFLVWKRDYPLRAHSVGKGALIGFIVGLVLFIAAIVLYFVLVVGIINSALQNFNYYY